jgi:ABC-type antimicrobial peptide transport system permease subunit
MSAAVREQTHEIGVRMALGAAPTRVRRTIIVETLIMFALGTSLGLTGALLGSRLLASMLYDVSPFDPASLLGASGLMLLVALLAVYVPARRATEVNPADVLRSA